MRKEVVLERSREIAQQNLETIHENSELFTEATEKLKCTHGMTGELATAEKVDVTGTGPRPGTRLLNAAYEDLDSNLSEQYELGEVGALLLRLSGVKPQVPYKKARLNGGGANACQMAEEEFSRGLVQVAKERVINQHTLSVYHDESGQPILFRKEQDEDTSLTLVPLSIKGLLIPAGTIATVPTSMDGDPSGAHRSRGFHMVSFLAPEELEIQPIRLSAWAYDDPVDRATFAVRGLVLKGDSDFSNYEYFQDKAALLAATSIEQYVSASRKLIGLCVD